MDEIPRADRSHLPRSERWALLRFSIVGPLFAAPPAAGELASAIAELAEKTWIHPVSGELTRFGFSTIERWYHQARREQRDQVGALRRKLRRDAGKQPALGEPLRAAIRSQYADHRSWSCQLHYDNLAVRVKADPGLGSMPSYSTLRRFLRSEGLVKCRRLSTRDSEGAHRAAARREQREVRSFEAEHVHALWHLDFHHGSHKVLTSRGEWVTPLALGVLDDRSRLACHLQWYLAETAENLIHGLCQAFLKRGLPRSLLTDNGGAMIARETTEGLGRLAVLHRTTLPYSPYQNGKQENFWAQLEGRLLAMMEGQREISLALLNEATQAWVEVEYHRRVHSETGQAPLERALQGPEVGRPSPESADLRFAFTTTQIRTQRRSDGTCSLDGRRFEIPSRYRTLSRPTLRFAAWDLTHVWLVDERTGAALCRIFPLDRARNADGRRRSIPSRDGGGGADSQGRNREPVPGGGEPGLAPLLRQLMADYAATGLPPAYLPKDDLGTVGVTGEIGASGAIGAADATDADFRAASARSHDEDPPNQPKEME